MLLARIACLFVIACVASPTIAAESPSPSPTETSLRPLHARRVQRAHEVWRAGDDVDGVIFGTISGATADLEGRIYVLDSQLSIIHVFGAEGMHVGTLSREGNGPGESRHPRDLCMLGLDRLGLAHPYPGRVITLDLNGVPAGEIHYDPVDGASCGFMVLQRIRAAGDLLILGGFCGEVGDKAGKGSSTQVIFVSRCTPDGRELGRYLERRRAVDYSGQVFDELDFDQPWDRVALARDGRLFLAPDRNRYLIQIFSPDGRMQLEIERDDSGLPRSSEQLAAVYRDLEALARYYKAPPQEIKVCPAEPCITGFWPRPDGELWVRTSRGDHLAVTDAPMVLDVYDETGLFRDQVSIDCPFDPNRDTLHPLGPDRLLVVQGGREASLDLKGNALPNESDELPMMICYQLREAAH